MAKWRNNSPGLDVALAPAIELFLTLYRGATSLDLRRSSRLLASGRGARRAREFDRTIDYLKKLNNALDESCILPVSTPRGLRLLMASARRGFKFAGRSRSGISLIRRRTERYPVYVFNKSYITFKFGIKGARLIDVCIFKALSRQIRKRKISHSSARKKDPLA